MYFAKVNQTYPSYPRSVQLATSIPGQSPAHTRLRRGTIRPLIKLGIGPADPTKIDRQVAGPCEIRYETAVVLPAKHDREHHYG